MERWTSYLTDAMAQFRICRSSVGMSSRYPVSRYLVRCSGTCMISPYDQVVCLNVEDILWFSHTTVYSHAAQTSALRLVRRTRSPLRGKPSELIIIVQADTRLRLTSSSTQRPPQRAGASRRKFRGAPTRRSRQQSGPCPASPSASSAPPTASASWPPSQSC